MNKLLIALLVVAVAAGAFFLLTKKSNHPITTSFDKQLIIGKWESLSPLPHATYEKFRFDFLKDGIALSSQNDSIKADTVSYKWNEKDQLIIQENEIDSIGSIFTVKTLTADSLQLLRSDSVEIFFKKVK